MLSCLLKDIHARKLETSAMLANNPLRLSNAINACLTNLNILSYYFLLALTFKYLCIFKSTAL